MPDYQSFNLLFLFQFNPDTNLKSLIINYFQCFH
jgi:hypothetical protein